MPVTATVSKNSSWATVHPAARSEAASTAALRCTSLAMAVSPSGPW